MMTNIFKTFRNLKLWQKILLSMILGILFGQYLRIHQEYHFVVKPIGTLYTNLLKMIIVPIVFFAILYGIAGIDNTESLGKIGMQASAIYIASTLFAVLIGIAYSLLIPADGVVIPSVSSHALAPSSTAITDGSLTSIMINIVPANIVAAMAGGQTLQVVFFAFVFGYGLLKARGQGALARECIISFSSVIFKMVDVVIFFTPLGVFAIMADVVSTHGLEVMFTLGKLISIVICALITQYLFFGALLMLVGLNPIKFYKKTANIQAIAFAASSSKAALATAIQDLQEKLGVSRSSASFIMPLGLTINMTATAIYLVICALFFAQVSGVEMTASKYFLLAISATIGSIGGAGFAGGGIIMMSMVFTSIGVSVDYIPLILGVDRILDMIRSMINVTGDSVVAIIIDKWHNTLDRSRYDA